MPLRVVSKITADGDCSHEIKRCLFLRRKTLTNLDSILKKHKFVLNIHVVKSIQPIPMELPLRLCSHTSRLILFIPAWPHEDPIGVPRTSLCRSPGAVSEGGEVQEARVALHPYRQVPWMPGCQRTSKGLPVPSACPPCLTCKGCGKTHSVTVKGCTLPG